MFATRALVGLLALALFPYAGPASVQAQATPTDQLPDLRLDKLYGVTVRRSSAGASLLRFGTRGFNIGAGPLEVRGSSPSGGEMGEVVQWIRDTGGAWRSVVPPDTEMFWSGDGHGHWHVNDFINVELFKRGELPTTRRIRKIGFCLIDLRQDPNPPANATPQRVYGFDACGTSKNQPQITMGISVGWADDYQPLIAHQWIDITTLPKGTYRLCAKINPLGRFVESNMANNFYWHDLWLNPATLKFEIRGSGRTRCGTYR